MVISIYPELNGEVRELRAEADITASGPFDSPRVIAGRLLEVPLDAQFFEIRASEVLFEGEVYMFNPLRPDGSFELHKAW